jgi:hypothetical protein
LGTNGNICEDPLFVDGINGDCHLLFDSPCRNGGDNSSPSLPEVDFEGDPRRADGFVDMGADEFHRHLYMTGDFTPGGSVQCKFVGWPGTSPIGLFLSLGVLDDPLQTQWGDFYLKSPFVLWVLFPIPATGVLILPATLPVDLPGPYDISMQALIGDQLSNLYVLFVK